MVNIIGGDTGVLEPGYLGEPGWILESTDLSITTWSRVIANVTYYRMFYNNFLYRQWEQVTKPKEFDPASAHGQMYRPHGEGEPSPHYGQMILHDQTHSYAVASTPSIWHTAAQLAKIAAIVALAVPEAEAVTGYVVGRAAATALLGGTIFAQTGAHLSVKTHFTPPAAAAASQKQTHMEDYMNKPASHKRMAANPHPAAPEAKRYRDDYAGPHQHYRSSYRTRKHYRKYH